MKINRELFEDKFTIESIPQWFCPICNKGLLKGNKKTIELIETVDSQNNRIVDDWCPEMYSGNFRGILKCNNNLCNENIFLIGQSFLEEVNISDKDQLDINHETYLYPKLFLPTLAIFEIHKDVPNSIVNLIYESFELYWIDEGSCANKIRIVVEHLLDLQKVVKTKLFKGKRIWFPLHKRIELFSNKRPLEAEELMAIKWIGNNGSHVNDRLKKNDLLDAYDILRHVTTKIYEKDSNHVNQLAKKINKAKKPLSK